MRKFLLASMIVAACASGADAGGKCRDREPLFPRLRGMFHPKTSTQCAPATPAAPQTVAASPVRFTLPPGVVCDGNKCYRTPGNTR